MTPGDGDPPTGGQDPQDRWIGFREAADLIESTTGCLSSDAARWLRQRVQRGDVQARHIRTGGPYPHRPSVGTPDSRATPVPSRDLLVDLAEVRVALSEFPAELCGPGLGPSRSEEDKRKRINFDRVVRIYAEAAHARGEDPSLGAVWAWLYPMVDAGLISVLGPKTVTEHIKSPSPIFTNDINNAFDGWELRAALKRVEFIEDEVRRWLPGPPAAAGAPSAGDESQPRGPKPKWDWTAIIARAAVEYWVIQNAGCPMEWKALREHIRDLGEQQNGRRPSETQAGEHASTIIRVLGEHGNSID